MQPVRPQNRPDQPAGARKVREESWGSSNPVVSSLGLLAFASIPGHTVYPHLFTNVNVAPDATVEETQIMRNRVERERERDLLKYHIFMKKSRQKWQNLRTKVTHLSHKKKERARSQFITQYRTAKRNPFHRFIHYITYQEICEPRLKIRHLLYSINFTSGEKDKRNVEAENGG